VLPSRYSMNARRAFSFVRRIACLVMISTLTVACDDGGTSNTSLLPLVDTLAQRLALADTVAAIKWKSHQPIEDAAREKVVLEHTKAQASAQGLDVDWTTQVFADQIEANKLVQYWLVNHWRRSAHTPVTKQSELSLTIRPHMDSLNELALKQLQQTQSLRASADCRPALDEAKESFVRGHSWDTVHAIALERALARVCAVPL
jgi:chorismate mutase